MLRFKESGQTEDNTLPPLVGSSLHQQQEPEDFVDRKNNGLEMTNPIEDVKVDTAHEVASGSYRTNDKAASS